MLCVFDFVSFADVLLDSGLNLFDIMANLTDLLI